MVERGERFDGPLVWLYIVGVMLAGLAIGAARWTDHLNLVTSMGLLGALAGVALAVSRFGGGTALWFSLIYGLFALGSAFGRMVGPDLPWSARAMSLLERLGSFIRALAHGQEHADPLMFVLALSILFWSAGSYGAWVLLRRKGLWGAILPFGLGIVINDLIYQGRKELGGYLAAYLLVCALMAARQDLWRRTMLWRGARARVPESLGLYLTRSTLIASGLVVALAWYGPARASSARLAQAWSRASEPIRRAMERSGKALGGLRNAMAVAYSFYPHELALEAGVQPLDSVILRLWPEERLERGARFYWAVRRYDTYQDGTWRGTLGTPWAFNPDQATLPVAQYRGRKAVQVRIEPQIPVLEALAVLPQTEWVDQPAKIRAHITPDGLDPLAFEIDTILWQETSYLVRGTVAAPSAEALRSASPQYPQWVLDHYLQLPASLTPRTRELARRITEGLQNPYDKAQAITSWLRRNVRYRRQTQPPPPGVEPLDWFLFDYRVGFCNWYASAEVIMLRSLGVPARLVVGFARGKFSDEGGFYEVRGEDAHAWPEVYFPGYGWVEFEPTGNQPALNRREPIGERALEAASPGGIWGEGPPTLERAEEESFGLSPIGPEADSARRRSAAAGRALVGLVVASCGIFLTRLWLDPGTRLRARIAGLRFLNRLAPKPLGGFEPLEHGSPLTLAYAAWNAWLPRLAVETGPHMTPMERAAAFAQSYPHLAPQAWALVHAYVGDRYGGQRRSLPLAMDRWRELRPRLWRAWLRQLLIARLRPPSARGHKPGPSPWPSPGPRG